MTREEKQKAIDALKISVPIKALTQEELNDYYQALSKIRDWLEQEPKSEWEHDHEILKAYSNGAKEVLDKLRAEIEEKADGSVGEIADGLYDALEMIDKYKAECEEV